MRAGDLPASAETAPPILQHMEAGFYGVASLGGPLGMGVSGTLVAGLDGLVKVDGAQAPYTVTNEYICGRLATLIGLPTPPGTIAELSDKRKAYVMLRFGDKGDKPPPADPVEVVADRPLASALLLAFDSWIMNSDRHAQNLAYVPGSTGAGLSVFDHGHALCGTTAGGAQAFLEGSARDQAWLGGCLSPELNSAVMLRRACDRLKAVPNDLIEEICEVPTQLGVYSEAEAKSASETLIYRRDKVWDHIMANQPIFPKIKDWR